MSRNDSAPPGSIRVLVVDDHPAVREGLALLLSTEGIDVCATAGRRAEALALAQESHPHLAIVDLSLDGEDGLLLVSDLKERGLPTLVYSMHNDARHVGGAFAAGPERPGDRGLPPGGPGRGNPRAQASRDRAPAPAGALTVTAGRRRAVRRP